MFKGFIISNNLGQIIENSSFKELTTIKIGGRIKYLYIPKNIEALQRAYKYINENNLKYFILGNGSNVLARDYDYDGIVILLNKLNSNIKYLDGYIEVNAFTSCNKLVNELCERNLGDLSYLAGIPGLIGGAIYNNCGSFGESISKNVIAVSYIDTNGIIQTIDNKSCAFGYRRSVFHYIEGIIIEVLLEVHEINTKEKIEKNIKNRKESQPISSKSMGSIFKNNPLIPSWKIIDALGLRGFQIGNAQVSQKHANFIINLGDAKSNDVMNLIELIETRARLELGIRLVREITIV